MLKYSTLILAAFILGGCVKVKLLPDGSVRQGLEATKNMYDESKIKRSGGVKRSFTRDEIINDHESRDAAEAACAVHLNEKVIAESPNQAPQVISENTSIKDAESGIITCGIEAFIWP